MIIDLGASTIMVQSFGFFCFRGKCIYLCELRTSLSGKAYEDGNCTWASGHDNFGGVSSASLILAISWGTPFWSCLLYNLCPLSKSIS